MLACYFYFHSTLSTLYCESLEARAQPLKFSRPLCFAPQFPYCPFQVDIACGLRKLLLLLLQGRLSLSPLPLSTVDLDLDLAFLCLDWHETGTQSPVMFSLSLSFSLPVHCFLSHCHLAIINLIYLDWCCCCCCWPTLLSSSDRIFFLHHCCWPPRAAIFQRSAAFI